MWENIKKIIVSTLVIFGVTILLSGCSSISSNDYKDTNWVAESSSGDVVDIEFTDDKAIIDLIFTKDIYDYELKPSKSEMIFTDDKEKNYTFDISVDDDKHIWTAVDDDTKKGFGKTLELTPVK